MPRTTDAVSRTRLTAPVPRVRYQYALGPMAANIIAVYAGQPEFLEARLHSIKAISHLGLNRRICDQLTEESAQEIAGLREALG